MSSTSFVLDMLTIMIRRADIIVVSRIPRRIRVEDEARGAGVAGC